MNLYWNYLSWIGGIPRREEPIRPEGLQPRPRAGPMLGPEHLEALGDRQQLDDLDERAEIGGISMSLPEGSL